MNVLIRRESGSRLGFLIAGLFLITELFAPYLFSMESSSDKISSEENSFVTKDELQEQLPSLAWKKGNYTITPYGIVWVNGVTNSSACVSDSFFLYCQSADVNDQASSAVDARTSRFGVQIAGPDVVGGYQLGGTFEIDFQGAVNMTRNKGQVQFRKGFVELKNEALGSRIEIGQDWDTISPLAPQMLNYLPCGFSGNIGYRRAQMRVEQTLRHSGNLKTLWTLGIADPFPGDFFTTSGVSANSGSWPVVEGRLGISLWESARQGMPVTIGVSGHIGENTYIFSPITNSFLKDSPTEICHPKTWSFNVDLDVPITKRLRFQGEYFLGDNLSSFCGGINQGVDLYTRDSVRTQGGWICLNTKVTDKLTNNTGCSVDDPFGDDLIGCTVADSKGNTNARTRNGGIFTNFFYQWNQALTTGLEIGYWKTDYRGANVSKETPVFFDMASGEDFRVEVAAQYKF